MVHCNNCTFGHQCLGGTAAGVRRAVWPEGVTNDLYTKLFQKAMEGKPDCGGLLSYNFYSGEPVANGGRAGTFSCASSDAKFTLANFMRTHLQSALATLKVGLDILAQEHVRIDAMLAMAVTLRPRGGQALLAAAIHAPVYVMSTAGEGGPWGMALLAAYLVEHKEGQSLEDWLATQVFADTQGTRLDPEAADAAGFDAFLADYRKGLKMEQAAVESVEL